MKKEKEKLKRQKKRINKTPQKLKKCQRPKTPKDSENVCIFI